MSEERTDQITDGGDKQATGGVRGGGQQEIDPEQLQAELTQIKDAMGLQERYPSRFTLWLVFGVCVLLASLGRVVCGVRRPLALEMLPGRAITVVGLRPVTH
jgi:hypothetical protein